MKSVSPEIVSSTETHSETIARHIIKARTERTRPSAGGWKPLDFFRKRGRQSLERRELVLPSGLSVAEAADMAAAISNALRRLHRQGQHPDLAALTSSTRLRRESGSWVAELPV